VKRRIFAALFIFCTVVAYGSDYQTPGSGSSYTLATLVSLSGGTVTSGPIVFSLNGNLTISQNDTLLMNPGEQLSVADDPAVPGFVLRIAGTLSAQGTASQPIIFTASGAREGSWHGIYMMPTSTGSVVQYCEIKFALTGINCSGCAPTISNNTFTGCRDAGIYCCRGAAPTITSNTFVNNSQAVGIIINDCVPAACAYNSANQNVTGITVANAAGSPVIANNSAHENRDIGIYGAAAAGAAFQDNIVEKNAYGVIVARGSNSQFLRNQVCQNIVEGIGITDDTTAVFRNTLIEDNSMTVGGVVVYDSALPDFGSPTVRGDNQFRDNHYFDYVNFTQNVQYAIGNTWISPLAPDYLIYDDDEDVGDADGSGFLSGAVVYGLVSGAKLWSLYE
jgi:parallel beta-helix repeat protein